MSFNGSRSGLKNEDKDRISRHEVQKVQGVSNQSYVNEFNTSAVSEQYLTPPGRTDKDSRDSTYSWLSRTESTDHDARYATVDDVYDEPDDQASRPARRRRKAKSSGPWYSRRVVVTMGIVICMLVVIIMGGGAYAVYHILFKPGSCRPLGDEPTTTEVSPPARTNVTYNTTQKAFFSNLDYNDGRMQKPQSVGIHPKTEIIFVTDSNHQRICLFTMEGKFLSCFLGFESAEAINNVFIYPKGIAFTDDGEIVVADEHRVMILKEVVIGVVLQKNVTRLLLVQKWGQLRNNTGTGDRGWSEVGQFGQPRDVATVGRLIYVADYRNRRIQILNRDDLEDITVIETSGELDGKMINDYPIDIAIQKTSDNIYVVTNYNLLIFDGNGKLLIKFEARDKLVKANAIAISSMNSQLYIADQDQRCVHIFSSDGIYLQMLNTTVYSNCEECFHDIAGIAINSRTYEMVVIDNFGYFGRMHIFSPEI